MRNFTKGIGGIVLGALLLLAVSPASAVTITFEGFSNTIYNAPITRSGFDIGNPSGQLQHFHEITSTGFGLPNNGTGILLNDRDTDIFVEANALSPFSTFSLVDVDVATASSNNPAVGITITGFLNNVQTGVVNLPALGSGYTTLLGGTLGVIDRLVFDGIGNRGGFVLDNLQLTPGGDAAIPEPATMSLLGLGLAGLAMRRKKQS